MFGGVELVNCAISVLARMGIAAFVLTIIIDHCFQIQHDEGVVAVSLPAEI